MDKPMTADIKAMIVDFISQSQQQADSPGALSATLASWLRKMTAAGTVVVVQCGREECDDHLVMAFEPAEHSEVAKSNEAIRLTELSRNLETTTLWPEEGRDPEIDRALARIGCGRSLVTPLRVGGIWSGCLLLLDLPDGPRLPQIVQTLDAVSTVAALVFRNALLFEQQELIIAERTAALSESEARYREICDQSLTGIFIHHAGTLLYANDRLGEMLGLTHDELVAKFGTSVLEFIYLDDRPMILANIEARLRNEEVPHRYEFRMARRDGSPLWVEILVSAVKREDKRAFFGNIIDISERKRAEALREKAEQERDRYQAQFLQSQKMEAIGRLAGGVAHDFNNLLTSILGNTSLALMDLSPEDSVVELIKETESAAERAKDLTKKLLTFSRKHIVRHRIIDLNVLLEQLQGMLTRLIGEDIEVRIRLDDEPLRIRSDPSQIEQLIVNLAVNARDAMPGGGTLVIETGRRRFPSTMDEPELPSTGEEAVLLLVSDTGHGFDETVKEMIFEPFFTTKPKGKGTGLGLSTVYGTVQQSGGHIEVESRVDHGTTFRIYLPAAENEAEAEVERTVPHVSPMPRGSETILVVEDEPILCQLAEKFLKRLGYTILTAEDAEEATCRAGSHEGNIDLLLTDVVLPGLSGPELARRLCETIPGLKVLYTSGYAEEEIDHHGVLEEGIQYIGKPYSMTDLARKIREVLEEP